MGIGGCPTRAGARYGDSEGRTFLEGPLAVRRRMDFPLLGGERAFEDGVALCHGARCTLGHRHSQFNPLDLITENRPRHDEVAATPGDEGERVNGVKYYSCEGYAGGATNTPTRVRATAVETKQFTRFLVGRANMVNAPFQR